MCCPAGDPPWRGAGECARDGAGCAADSSVLLGQTYPASTVVGFDDHDASIRTARTRAGDAGVADRVTFETASAETFAGTGYDAVFIFDALHDMGDPLAALRHIRDVLAPEGVLVVVEPNAADTVEGNLNLVGQIFYSASTFICTQHSRWQSGEQAACLGAQAGQARLTALAEQAGFRSVRRAAETPFNIVVLELRP
ncbi:MAG: class I SAM-dependent methyltransferase [Acidimicrobiia bacterium]|nr:class I SAM-dependent methyltransferase [Acidimicrobiia bacterium]